ncbi:transglycosylase domain-containing protein [Lysobacter sp. K5869]|uniref:transglycosylase domain-containing protein n=1 Tax=Lysobacter sp. K5869 TaxID=2820808 RepID=UPI001C0640ED|nr:transglycosylase domain-containing protein [Lysobacter sp. K5869]QWP74641.1 transglycosylase domain-containing protein [Lysobacter sp. K5869]
MKRAIQLLAATALIAVAAPFTLLYAMYWHALKDLPEPLPQAQRAYPDALRKLYWTLHDGQGPIQVRRMSPPGFAWELFAASASERVERVPADHQLLYRVASTMQARLLPHGTISRWHLTNAALTIHLSRKLEAAQLIDYVLDQTRFAADAGVGIEAAARHYFDLPLQALSPQEQLALLILDRGPSYYDPACHPERFAKRYAYALGKTGLASAQAMPERLRPGECKRPIATR